MDLNQLQTIISIIGGIFTIVGIPVVIYRVYVKDKEKDSDKIAHVKEMEMVLSSKVEVLKTGLESKIESMATIMGTKIEGLTSAFIDIKKNDLHSMYEKQKDQDAQIGKLTVELSTRMGKLETIVDERIPKKH